MDPDLDFKVVEDAYLSSTPSILSFDTHKPRVPLAFENKENGEYLRRRLGLLTLSDEESFDDEDDNIILPVNAPASLPFARPRLLPLPYAAAHTPARLLARTHRAASFPSPPST